MRDPGSRWTFIALLSTATFVNYLDRGSLAVALPLISRDLHLNPVQQGVALSSFFWTYAALQIPVGWLVDRYEIKRLYASAFAIWSLAAAATGLATGLGTLMACRILLGLGESIYLPGGMKVVGRHFGSHESAWPAGLFDLGAKLGLAAGTAVDVWLLLRFGWRSLFFRTGLVGLLWLVPWLWLYPSDTRRRASGGSERAPTPGTAAVGAVAAPPSGAPRSWSSLVKNPALVGMSVGFFCWDYFWYFVVSWLPSYLYVVRHVRLAHVAFAGSAPFLIFALAEALGAWSAGRFVRRGFDLLLVTKGFIALGFALGLLVIPAALVASPVVSIGLLFGASLAGLACGNMLALPTICASYEEVALWTGVQNFVGNIGGILAPVATGYLIARTGSYVPAFMVVAAILVAGIASYVCIVPGKQLSAPGELRYSCG